MLDSLPFSPGLPLRVLSDAYEGEWIPGKEIAKNLSHESCHMSASMHGDLKTSTNHLKNKMY